MAYAPNSRIRYGLNVACGFVKRDLRLAMSYRFQFLLKIFSAAIIPLGWYFLAFMVKGMDISYLKPYGGDFFTFIIIGIAFFNFFDLSVRSFAGAIRGAQLMGTLEMIFQSRISTPIYLLGATAWGYIFAFIRMLIMLVVSVFVLGAVISPGANLPLIALILVMGILAGSSLGLFAASFTMLYKSGDPTTEVFYPLSLFFSGVYFPVTVLPEWLRWISYLLPTYYALDALRLILIQGMGIYGIKLHILALLTFILVVFPIGVAVFNIAVKKAKTQGTLTTY